MMCMARSIKQPLVFCELDARHAGDHRSTAHAWDRDGDNYREDWTLGIEEARKTLGWQYPRV